MPSNAGTSTVVPLEVRAQATAFQHNCAVNNLIPDIEFVIRHHEDQITPAVRHEAVAAFNAIWNTHINWDNYKALFLGMENRVRREVIFGPVLRQCTTDPAVKAMVRDAKGHDSWPMLTSTHAGQVARKYKIQVEEYRTNEVALHEVNNYRRNYAPAGGGLVPPDLVPPDLRDPNFNQFPAGERIANPLRTSKLIHVMGSHFSHHGAVGLANNAAARAQTAAHNADYTDEIVAMYGAIGQNQQHFETLQNVVSTAVRAGANVGTAMQQFERRYQLNPANLRNNAANNASNNEPAEEKGFMEQLLDPEAMKKIQEVANTASAKIGEMIGTESQFFGPIFSSIPKLLAGIISLLSVGLPIFKQLGDMFKKFLKSFASPDGALSQEEISGFSENLEVGSEAADFAQAISELEGHEKGGSAAAKILNKQVRGELKTAQKISPELWAKLINELMKNGFTTEAKACLQAREEALLEKLNKLTEVDPELDGDLLKKYKEKIAIFEDPKLTGAKDKLKSDLFKDRVELFKVVDAAYSQITAFSDEKEGIESRLQGYQAEMANLRLAHDDIEGEEVKGNVEQANIAERLAYLEALIQTSEAIIKKDGEEINTLKRIFAAAVPDEGGRPAGKAEAVSGRHNAERGQFIEAFNGAERKKAEEDREVAEAKAAAEERNEDVRIEKARQDAEHARRMNEAAEQKARAEAQAAGIAAYQAAVAAAANDAERAAIPRPPALVY